MSIFKKYGIKRTRENIETVEQILRAVPRYGKPLSEDTRDAARRLMLALNRDGWDGPMVFDMLPFKVDVESYFDNAEAIPLAAVEALHAFYCEQTGTRNASMARHSVRDTAGKKQDAPALRFVTECLQQRNERIAISAVEKLWRGRKSKGPKAV